MNLENLREEMVDLMKCCLKRPRFLPGDIVEVVLWRWSDYTSGYKNGPKDERQTESYAIVRLASGEYGVLTEAEDFTGHG